METSETIAGPLSGHCLCGRVSFRASELAPHFYVCHCGMCRRWSGGPSMTVIAKRADFDGREHITEFQSSEWARRAFCSRCGSNLYYRFSQSDDWFLWAGLLDDQARFTLGQEIYIDNKPPGYAFEGDHARLTEQEFLKSIGMA